MLCLVCGEKGGIGKTSIAVNLVALAAADGAKTLLMDTDTTGSATEWIRIRSEGSFKPEIPLLGVGPSSTASIHDLLEVYDVIVVDVGARSFEVMDKVALMADLVLVPVTPGQFETHSTQKVFARFQEVGYRHRFGAIPAWVLLNEMPTNSRSTEEADLRSYLDDLGIPTFGASIKARKAWRDISRTGKAVFELTGRDRSVAASDELRSVYEEAAHKVNTGAARHRASARPAENRR